ncbi:MFS transporter [Litchfieldella xinjiangensis]|uniref:MFS transporter n=1 Tax=Litchfieldella xinjiangensis TaxID=1166948 RepID=UPI0006948A42|nr:MFS transporter [Halomonas xinjiangensis]
MTVPLGATLPAPAIGYRPLVTILLSPLAFALVFACWTIFAVIGVEWRDTLGLDEMAFAGLLALPMLSGALVSLPAARLAVRFGERRVMIGCLWLMAPSLWWIGQAEAYRDFLLAGAGLGLGAGTLVAGLARVALGGPTRHVGLALGLYGAGMLGAGLSYLLLPLVSQAYGWRLAPYLYLLLILMVSLLLWLYADDLPPRRSLVAPGLTNWLPRGAAWRLAFYYSFFFGAFVALALWLPGYLAAHYRLPLGSAALWSLAFTIPGGAGQVLGGALADWRDFRSLRWWVGLAVLACLFWLSYPDFSIRIEGLQGEVAFDFNMPLWGFIALLSVMGLAMGIGKGSLMRLIYREHPHDMARVGGLALALGGLFAAVLPLLFVLGDIWIGIRTVGFMFLYAALGVCLLVMLWEQLSTS